MEAVRKCNEFIVQNRVTPESIDTLLQIININCDSGRRYFVDIKIRTLMTKGSFQECLAFVDSLSSEDFYYPYKKGLMHDYLIARQVQGVDTVKYQSELRNVTVDLETYIAKNKLENAELQEAFVDLFTLKKQFADSVSIRREIDSLSQVYPSQANFLKFLY
jgi:hypothetical protein